MRTVAVLVILLLLVNILNFMDRVAIGVLGRAIRTDLSLTGAQFGLLTGAAFATAYALAALPMARLADRAGKTLVLPACMVLWSAAMVGTALADGFGGLVVSRLMVALGESAAAAICYSIVAATVPPSNRATAIAIVSSGAPLGSFASGLLFPALAAAYGWRAAFLWAGVGGLIFAPLLWWALRRIAPEQPSLERKQDSLWLSLVRVWRHAAQRWLATLYFAVVIVMTAVVAWMPQIFQGWHGLPLQQAGAAFGLALLVGGMAGTAAIPALLARRSKGDSGAALATALRLTPLGLVMLAVSLLKGPVGPTAALAVGVALVTCALPLIFAMVADVAEGRGLTETNAAIFLPGNLVATSVGPLIVGLVNDAMPTVNDPAGPMYGLLVVLAVGALILAVGGWRRPGAGAPA
jgi:predicted MFS family arabinose efflux permease